MADPRDYYRCDKCGTLTHINMLDAKPSSPDEGADFDIFECRECYGVVEWCGWTLRWEEGPPIEDDEAPSATRPSKRTIAAIEEARARAARPADAEGAE